MIRHLKNQEVEREKWDECIASAFNGCAYGYSWYLDIVSPGWEALVEDDYDRVFPLPSADKFGIAYSMQPYFTQQLGVFSKTKLTPGVVSGFLEAIPGEYKYIDLNLNVHNGIQLTSWKIHEMSNYELDLIADYAKLTEGYSQQTRRNLKKNAGITLSLAKSIKPEEVVTLFRRNRGSRLRQLGDNQYAVLLRLIYACIYKDMARVWGVYDEHNELCAGVVWLFSHQKAVFLFSGLSETGRRIGAMPYLTDCFIKEHAGQPLTLDFEGSNDEGLARFYAGFGSRRMTYFRVVINRLPFIMRASLEVARRVRSIF